MSDKIIDRERTVVSAAIDLLRSDVYSYSEQGKASQVETLKACAFELLRAAYQRDVYRRSMPRKRAKK